MQRVDGHCAQYCDESRAVLVGSLPDSRCRHTRAEIHAGAYLDVTLDSAAARRGSAQSLYCRLIWAILRGLSLLHDWPSVTGGASGLARLSSNLKCGPCVDTDGDPNRTQGCLATAAIQNTSLGMDLKMKFRLKRSTVALFNAVAFMSVAGCGGANSDAADLEAFQADEAETAEGRRSNDRTAPTVTIGAAIPSAAGSGSFSVSGTASDDRWVYRVYWSNDRGGNGQAQLSGSRQASTWSVPSIALQNGDQRRDRDCGGCNRQ